MIILPAIDMKDSRCVRLQKGDFSTASQVADDPLETAGDFAAAGAKWVHMVDLDGARDGVRSNFDQIRQVIQESGLNVELGGGIKTEEDAAAVISAGAARIVLGSAAVDSPELLDSLLDQYGEQIAVGIDCKNGIVRTSGWEKDSGLDYLEFAKEMEQRCVQTIIFTDIDADGMLSGPNFEQLERLRDAVGCQIIASGGITTLEDVIRLRDLGMYGAIIGKAYYAGTIDLAQAVAEAGKQG